MGVREKINEKPQIVGGAVIATLAFAGIFVYQHMRNDAIGLVPKMYYSDDDGKTFFADDTKKVFPFDHNGKQAYRAYVFQGSGQPFVGYLSRYTDSAKAQLNELQGKENDPTSAAIISRLQNSSVQVKKPGESKWVPQTSAEGSKVEAVQSLDGGPIHDVLP